MKHRALCAAGALLCLLGCGEEEAPRVPSRRIVLLGRVERSATVDWRLVAAGDTVPDSLVTLVATDPSRMALLDSSRLRLDSAGALTLVAMTATDTVRSVRDIPAPPTIVFDQVSDSGNRDIWRVALDGRDLQRLTTNAADDRDPTVAGTTVTFVSFRSGGGDLWRVPLSGGSNTQVTSTAEQDAEPAAAPNGGALAFVRYVGGLPKLYRITGTGATPLTGDFSDGAVDGAPSWAPAADRLAFASSQSGPVRLWSAVIGSGALDTIAGHTTGADVEPAWSPEGGRIVFASSRDGPTELYLLTLATGAVTRLTTAGGTNGRPAWTADGRIVYVAFLSGHPTLRWLDPADPAVIHEIPVGTDADHPASPF